jgi:hypothetical protein
MALMPNHEPEITFVSGFTIDSDAPMLRPPEHIPKPRNETITLRGIAVPLDSTIGGAFIADLSRNKERLFSDAEVIEKYDISETAWTEITQNKAIRLAVNSEHERRTFNGDAAREAAAKQFTKAPAVLGGILEDQKASPRHRIEAAKELRATANTGTEKPGADTERFTITINLGNDEKIVVDTPLPTKQAKDTIDAERET